MSEEKKVNEAGQGAELDDSELKSVAGGRGCYIGGSPNFDESTGRYKGETGPGIGGVEKMPKIKR
jgi:hypothetical protein